MPMKTTPYQDQKPGTSGLRKKVKVFKQENYLHNFVAAIFKALPSVKGTLLIGGDGRYWNREAIQIILQIAAGYGVKSVIVPKGGLASTPACSAIIRSKPDCFGGILLTASHNPGGPDNDFGIKYNTENGSPAPESLTDKIFEITKTITEYNFVDLPQVDIDTVGTVEPVSGFKVEIFDGVTTWLNLMKELFDFEAIRKLIARKDFKFIYDGLNGVAGPYAKALFLNELKADEKSLQQCESKPDFGGGHPDPNLTYADKLVAVMKPLDPEASKCCCVPDFGAAGDGDNDRNMILGKGFFVTPSDSVAIIAAYAEQCIPQFMKSKLKGVARSMPTSCALDAVAKAKKLECYETPTGWKYFGNLLDAGRISICGEESFGTGSDHIREKDGLWAVLCWLSILAYRNQDVSKPLVSVQQIVEEHWREYGRNFYSRYDYEEVDSESAKTLMNNLTELYAKKPELIKKYSITKIDNFEYKDPVDNSVSKNQGVRVFLNDGSRIIWRLSGTGSVGATVRIYLERYAKGEEYLKMATVDALKDISEMALNLCEIERICGRAKPTVIT